MDEFKVLNVMNEATLEFLKDARFAGRTDCDIIEEGAKFARENFQYKDEDLYLH